MEKGFLEKLTFAQLVKMFAVILLDKHLYYKLTLNNLIENCERGRHVNASKYEKYMQNINRKT
jgi:hypothetical protein